MHVRCPMNVSCVARSTHSPAGGSNLRYLSRQLRISNMPRSPPLALQVGPEWGQRLNVTEVPATPDPTPQTLKVIRPWTLQQAPRRGIEGFLRITLRKFVDEELSLWGAGVYTCAVCSSRSWGARTRRRTRTTPMPDSEEGSCLRLLELCITQL